MLYNILANQWCRPSDPIYNINIWSVCCMLYFYQNWLYTSEEKQYNGCIQQRKLLSERLRIL